MKETTLVVVNPAAGGERGRQVWHRLQNRFPALATMDHLLAEDATEAEKKILQALTPAVNRVLIVGGDGTAHLVVNGLLRIFGPQKAPAFGLIPAGTGSDLARSLGLPSNPQKALQHVLNATPRRIDAIEIKPDRGHKRFVINTASAGLSGFVAPAVNANPRRGHMSYLTATLGALWRYRAVPCRVLVEDQELYQGTFFILAVTNGRYFGKGMPIAPPAQIDDGLLDVVLIPPVPFLQLPYRLIQFLTGRHILLPFVQCLQATHVRLEPEVGFPPYELDGETLPAGPVEMRILPAALQVLA